MVVSADHSDCTGAGTGSWADGSDLLETATMEKTVNETVQSGDTVAVNCVHVIWHICHYQKKKRLKTER